MSPGEFVTWKVGKEFWHLYLNFLTVPEINSARQVQRKDLKVSQLLEHLNECKLDTFIVLIECLSGLDFQYVEKRELTAYQG